MITLEFVVNSFVKHEVEFDMIHGLNDEYSIHVILGNQEYVVPVNDTEKLGDMYCDVYQYHIRSKTDPGAV